jgi:hypothetical protein
LKNWSVEKSYETDLEEPLIDYVFTHNGMSFVCDADEKVRTIFLDFDASRRFDEGVDDLLATSSRREVIARLGSAWKSGGPISDPVLGEYGVWDRFACDGYVIPVEYRPDADAISKITVMQADVVP